VLGDTNLDLGEFCEATYDGGLVERGISPTEFDAGGFDGILPKFESPYLSRIVVL
jgi:hypothetical protein